MHPVSTANLAYVEAVVDRWFESDGIPPGLKAAVAQALQLVEHRGYAAGIEEGKRIASVNTTAAEKRGEERILEDLRDRGFAMCSNESCERGWLHRDDDSTVTREDCSIICCSSECWDAIRCSDCGDYPRSEDHAPYCSGSCAKHAAISEAYDAARERAKEVA